MLVLGCHTQLQRGFTHQTGWLGVPALAHPQLASLFLLDVTTLPHNRDATSKS